MTMPPRNCVPASPSLCRRDEASRRGCWYASLLLALVAAIAPCPAQAADGPLLVLESKIPLGSVIGPLPQMAVDVPRRRLYVAEPGNDSLDVVDLKAGKTLRRVEGLSDPRSLGYLAATDMLYVANARDGSLRMLRGADLVPAGRVPLGEGADSIRFDEAAGRVLVGYGRGAIAVVDAVRRLRLADIPLPVHAEGFELEPGGKRLFVNLPALRRIGVIDRGSGKEVASWRAVGMQGGSAMALDAEGRQVILAYRTPATLVVFASATGKPGTMIEACGDAGAIFGDAKRDRLYLSCGDGTIDIFHAGEQGYERAGSVSTVAGARVALFVPELDRLYLAVRGSASERPAIWVYRPVSRS